MATGVAVHQPLPYGAMATGPAMQQPQPVGMEPITDTPAMLRIRQQQQLAAQMMQMHGNTESAAPLLPAAAEPELQEQLLRLAQEHRELKDYANRVTRELRRYQQARPTPPPAGPDDDLPLPPWATNMRMMSPLLFSYEERIAELEAVIERSVSLAEQAQVLAKENDQLRGELHERTEQLRNAQILGSGSPIGVGGNPQEEEVQELYRLSVEQNEALAQQNQLLKLQLERMQQALAAGQQQAREVHARAYEQQKSNEEQRTEYTRLINEEQHRTQAERQRTEAEQQRTENLLQQRAAAEQRLEEVTTELVEQVNNYDSLEAKVEGLQHELLLQRQSAEMNKKNFEERCTLASDDEARLKAELAKTHRSEKEYRRKLADTEQSLAEVTEKLSVTRRDGEATKQQAEQMLRLIESMERRLEDISDRHDDAQSRLQEKEDQVAQLLIEKDRWSSSEEASKRHTERVEARLQADLENLRQQRDQEIDILQSTHRKAIADLEERLHQGEQSTSDLRTKVELSEKQRAWDAAAHERQTSALNTERDRLKGDLEDAEQARLRLERQSAQTQIQIAQLKTELDTVSAKSKEQIARASSEQASLRSRFQTTEQQLAQADGHRTHAELQEERLRLGDQLEAEQRRAASERRGLERQLKAIQSRSQQEEQRAAQLLRSQEALRLQWQMELGLERDELEAKVARLQKENHAIKEKVRGGLKALAQRRDLAGGNVNISF
eukprot:TRINITY_DN10570_c0_g1_i1.p1 TRINITY_DN10570_c0_g1~~TRINITY_DN10570_c0_g1_i1.p1  ORF type:complete len:726 (-),score=243.47 TRINITY_DN10570_c0_g1_i1:76-2253(-)